MQREFLRICRAACHCGRITTVFNHIKHKGASARPSKMFFSSSPETPKPYSVLERGHRNTQDYRVFFKDASGNIVSPFHDIPLFADSEKKICNMVVEIPRWTNAKMEICKEEKLNPIKQDVKKGKLRFVKNVFPHHGYIWNYGALPQTWEDPKHKFGETDTLGDNDPLDVCEIGHKVQARGAVVQVKVLGTMLLIDEGETDWKIIAIDVTDPLADKLNDIQDVDKLMPGFLRATHEWLKFYKKPDGKPVNKVHWNGNCKNKEFAMGIVDLAYGHWKQLICNPASGADVKCANTTQQDSPCVMSGDEAKELVMALESIDTGSAADPVDQDVNKWHFVICQEPDEIQQ